METLKDAHVWEQVNQWVRNGCKDSDGALMPYWESLCSFFGIDWVEKNIRHVNEKYRQMIHQKALMYFEMELKIKYTFTYSEELYEKFKGEKYETCVRTVENHGRTYQILEVIERTSLKELTGDYSFKYVEGEIRTTDVRYTMRRQLNHVFRHGATWIRFESRTCETFEPHTKVGLEQMIKHFVDNLLPCAYPNKAKRKIDRIRFEENFPNINIYADIVYKLYKIAGQTVIDYYDRLYVVREDGFNVIHDGLYLFESKRTTDMLTPATLREMLSWHSKKIARVMNVLSQFPLHMDCSLKEKRKTVKGIVFSEHPYEVASKMLTEMIQEKELALFSEMRIHPDMARSFLERMHVYAPHASIEAMRKTFGLQRAKKMIKGTYEGMFEPESFPAPLRFLGEDICKALGKNGKSTIVKNPKRLYTRLSKMGDVKDMLTGNIARPIEVMGVLRNFGVYIPEQYKSVVSLRAVIEEKCSPEFLVAGDASVCCMSFGAENAKSYAVNKGFGVLNVYLGKRIIANSVLWINELPVGQALVIDNIEVAPNYVSYNPYITDLYQDVIQVLMNKYHCEIAVQGRSYSDLELEKIEHPLTKFQWRVRAKDVPEQDFYSDAREVHIVATTQTAEEQKCWEKQMTTKHAPYAFKSDVVERAFNDVDAYAPF